MYAPFFKPFKRTFRLGENSQSSIQANLNAETFRYTKNAGNTGFEIRKLTESEN